MTRNVFKNTNKMTLKSILHFIFWGVFTQVVQLYRQHKHTQANSSSALPCWFVLCTLYCNYHAAVTGSKSFATKLLISFNQKVAKHKVKDANEIMESMLKSSSQFFDLILKYSQKIVMQRQFRFHRYYIEVASAEVPRHSPSIPSTM